MKEAFVSTKWEPSSFWIQDFAQQDLLCIFTASNSLFCHAQKMNYCTGPDIPLTSCPFLSPNLIGTVAGGAGGCLGLGGGWDGNRWWFGRVIKRLDICFNELATQRIKYGNSELQSSQPVIAVLFTESVCCW